MTGKKFQGCISAQVIPETISIDLVTHTTQTDIKMNKNDTLCTYFISVRKNNHYNKLEGSCVSFDVLNIPYANYISLKSNQTLVSF